MDAYIIIGAPGRGKTPFVRELIGTDRRCFVLDINNEYGARTKYPGQVPVMLSDNVRDPRSRMCNFDVKEFCRLVLMKRDTICVFEEATVFFQGAQSLQTRQILVNRYHTGNRYAFLFHSINAVPPRIMEMCNYVVLFHTLDQDDNVLRKFSSISQAYLAQKAKPEGACTIIKQL